MFIPILIFVFLLLVYYFCTKHYKISPEYHTPNGPSGVSLYGRLFQALLMAKPHLQFSKWACKYGKTYTINIFGTNILIANDVKTVKQIFGTIESTGKPKLVAFEKISGGKYGILETEGNVWLEVRTFTMKILKDCGISRSSVVEPAVWQTCNELLEWFGKESKNCGGVVNPLREKFIGEIGNIFWNIATKSETKCSDSGMGKLVLNFIDALKIATKSGLLFLPWLKYVAPEWSGYNKLSQACTALHMQVDKYFEERKQYRKVVKVEPQDRNLLDAYLDQWENCKEEKSCFHGENGWKHCFYSLVHFVIGSGETTATTLNWLINYLVACQDVQQKLYNEIKTMTVLQNTMPILTETRRLPYLKSVICETLRMSSLAPFGIIHKLFDSVKFEGYHIPKDTILIANVYHAHHDKTVWGDPENFRPERFLDVDEITKTRLKQSVIAFQPGKRACPGEGLARDMLLLVTARLVQNFQFLPAYDKTPRDYIEPEAGYMLFPKQIGVKVKARI